MIMKKIYSVCPVCSDDNPRFVLRSDVGVYQCPSCSHVFSNPAAITHYEKYEKDYYELMHKNWFENPNLKLFSWIQSVLPDTVKSILDVGCGNGMFLRYIKDNAPAIKRLVGVDYSPNKSIPGIEFITGDAANIPGNEKFDAVINLAVIEHVQDPVGFAHILSERCKVGGYVVTMTVNNSSLLYRIARLMHRCEILTPAVRLYSSHHLQHFTISSLRSTLEQAGLEIIATRKHNPPFAAIDFPSLNFIERCVFTVGLIGLLFFSSLSGMPYLQTVVARRV
jgi:2-polyprenyl-3-methyl-5-hydroxy-6-metoxy-1,4-benzoquinol methylase